MGIKWRRRDFGCQLERKAEGTKEVNKYSRLLFVHIFLKQLKRLLLLLLLYCLCFSCFQHQLHKKLLQHPQNIFTYLIASLSSSSLSMYTNSNAKEAGFFCLYGLESLLQEAVGRPSSTEKWEGRFSWLYEDPEWGLKAMNKVLKIPAWIFRGWWFRG